MEICKKRFELYGLSAIFINGNIEEAGKLIKDKNFDLIYSFGVIHHTIEHKNVINSIYNLLKDNGEFRFMVYSKISFKLFWLMMEKDIKDLKELEGTITTPEKKSKIYACFTRIFKPKDKKEKYKH